MSDSSAFHPSDRSRLRRLAKRARYDRATVHAILDAGLIAHVGYSLDGQPYVTPTAYWRVGDDLYWHGSSASRMLRTVERGVPVCVTVALLDGLVVARSGFHHSINYRSVMAFGTASLVSDDADKEAALERFMERLYPGRWAELRPMSTQELAATKIVRMPIEEASAKVRTGPPIDDEPDYARATWAGVVPISTVAGAPIADERLEPGAPVPRYLEAWALSAAPGGESDET